MFMGDNMKKSSLILILAALLAGSVKAQPAPEAPKTKLETVITEDFLSLYRMRGLDFSTGAVSQTNIIMNYGHLSGVLFVDHNFDKGHIDEYDFIVRYTDTVNVSIAGVKPIVIGQFVYEDMARQASGKSKEAATIITLPTTLNPTLTVAKDFDKGKGEYFSLGFNQDVFADSSSGVSVNVSGAVGFNNKYWTSTSSWSHADVSLRIPVNLKDGWVLTPNITYSKSLNKEYFTNATITGVQISKSF